MDRILFSDIIKSITIYLSEYDKLLFLSSSKYLHGIKNMITWDTPIGIHLAPIVTYSNKFSKIKIDCSLKKLKKLVQQLAQRGKTIDTYFAFATEIIITTRISDELAKLLVPSSIIHCRIRDTNIDISLSHTNISHVYLEFKYICQKVKPLKLCKKLSVTHLFIGNKFCYDYNEKMIIPKNITHIYVGRNNDELDLVLHDSLMHLELESYDVYVSNSNFIPISLTNLLFDDDSKIYIDKIYPVVTHLRISYYQANNFLVDLKCFPNLLNLIIGSDNLYDSHISCNMPSLTSSVTYLKFGTRCNFPITDLFHSNLVHIIFGHMFNQDISGCITVSCKYLEFGLRFEKYISIDILKRVLQIKIDSRYPYIDSLKQEFRGELIIK